MYYTQFALFALLCEVSLMKKIKVAQIIGKASNGGVEACILNYYKNVDRDKIQFDFFVSETSDIINEEIIKDLGGSIVITPKYTNLFKYINFLIKTFKKNEYDIVHSNLNSLSVFPLFAAKIAKVRIRIAHSHSTTNKKEVLRNLIKNFLKLFSKLFANEYFACSELAGIWLFGKNTFKKGEVFVVNNAVDLNRFKFNNNVRDEVRSELGICKDTIVLGNVGRLSTQKNQKFLINLLSELDLSKYKLLILGQGNLDGELKKQAQDLKLQNNIIFVKKTSTPERFYNSFDLFLLPSLYEGLPVSGIEAQVNSLPCLFSVNVTRETKVLESTKFLSINSTAYRKEEIEKIDIFKRDNSEDFLKNFSKYDIVNQGKILTNKYLQLIAKYEKTK